MILVVGAALLVVAVDAVVADTKLLTELDELEPLRLIVKERRPLLLVLRVIPAPPLLLPRAVASS